MTHNNLNVVEKTIAIPEDPRNENRASAGTGKQRAYRGEGVRFPWKIHLSLPQETGQKIEWASKRLGIPVPALVRQSVDVGLPILVERLRKRRGK